MWPGLIHHGSRDDAVRIKPQEIMLVRDPYLLMKIDHRFQGLLLREVVLEVRGSTVCMRDGMIRIEPPVEKCLTGIAYTLIT